MTADDPTATATTALLPRTGSITTTKIVLSAIGFVALSLANVVVLYYLLASPPIHWWYDVAPPAGPYSVYVPGELS